MVTVFRNWVGVMIRKSILQEINDIVGKDCKYEDSYLNIEIEIDKISSVTQDTCDFRTVLSECETLLSKDTKDFKIATWWFYTNFKINQIEGLKYSIDCFIEFINKFYTSFYPKSKISNTNRDVYKVLITKVGVYMKDTYEFVGRQYLGHWNCSGVGIQPLSAITNTSTIPGYNFKLESSTAIGNDDFNKYRKENKKGGDMLLFSDVKKESTNIVVEI